MLLFYKVVRVIPTIGRDEPGDIFTETAFDPDL
jgi:hypothetical protein